MKRTILAATQSIRVLAQVFEPESPSNRVFLPGSGGSIVPHVVVMRSSDGAEFLLRNEENGMNGWYGYDTTVYIAEEAQP